ncbi:MAG: hypothetical protein DRI71_07175 [Bacteroidetes bacterium]|nr:MAG: hypothetical protein DRI71_07175 [Bacteroidota bacterium]
MKINIKHLTLSLIVSLFFLGACQEEVIEITNPQNDTTISSDSPIVGLVEQTTLADGSLDNILDNSSCTTIVLPVTVIANGQEVVINSEDDYVLVERIFDESDSVNTLTIVYPITVILADHSMEMVNNNDELADLVEDCIEGGADDDIECIDFVYPINISVYDGANQVLDVIVITDDEELHDLFESLEDDEFLSFEFPLVLILSDSTEVTVFDNTELEDLIESAEGACDEDDDNDYNDDDIDDTDLVAVLLDGEWEISYFFDEIDETTEFSGFMFEFFEDGSAIAVKDSITTEGHWESYGDDGSLKIELNFSSESPLDELEEDWLVFSFTETRLELSDDNDDGTTDSLVFEKL